MIIIINKVDLDKDNSIDYWVDIYKACGYTVIKSSIITDTGINEIKSLLKGSKNLFWGHSGVGKSSILNKIYRGLNLEVGAVDNYKAKGTHTTVTSTMIKTGENTYIIDTPGIREIDPYGILKEDLGHYFTEFQPYIRECRFNTCTHCHEPGCAVIKAAEEGAIPAERYDSYLRILETIEQDIIY